MIFSSPASGKGDSREQSLGTQRYREVGSGPGTQRPGDKEKLKPMPRAHPPKVSGPKPPRQERPPHSVPPSGLRETESKRPSAAKLMPLLSSSGHDD